MNIDEIMQLFGTFRYAQSLLILMVFYLISKIVLYVSKKFLIKITAKTKTKVDDLILEKTSKPISLFLLWIGLRLAIVPLPLTESSILFANNIVSSLIIVTLSYIGFNIFNIMINEWGKSFAKRTKTHMDDTILSLFHKISQVAIGLLMILLVLDVWGLKIGPILASLGIAGLAVAFALQPTLSNIFGGISLILDKTIKIGDIIKLDSGEAGKIYDIGIRSTKIKTWDNEIVTVPNGKLVESKIQNKSLPDPSIRVNIIFGVEYGSDIEKVKKVIMDIVKKIPNVLKDPKPVIWFLDMGDFALKFKMMFWVDELGKKWPTHQKAITSIYNELNKRKIGIPFPTSTVYLKK